jgi:hypothetical protein
MAKPVTTRFGNFVVKLGNDAVPIVYSAPCGFTSKSLQLTKDLTEVNIPDCDNPDSVAWIGRDAASLSAQVSGDGILASESVDIWLDAWENSNSVPIEISVAFPSKTIVWTGYAQVSELTISAEQGGRVTISVTLMSDGELTRVSNETLVTVLAHKVYGPGYNSGAAPLTGDGSAKGYNVILTNETGAPITTASIALQGWTLTLAGTTDTGNSFSVISNVEYPVGTISAVFPTTVVPSGQNVATAPIPLTTPIPIGGAFRVTLVSTPANGQKYIANIGFAGLRSHVNISKAASVRLMGVGDSIMTNNGSAVYNAATGKCPAYINSIIGATAKSYGDNSAQYFARQADLASLLGITHIISNFGTNDFGSSDTVANLKTYLGNMRDAARGKGVAFVQATILPRTNLNVSDNRITATSVTGSGTTINAVVPDASKFTVGHPYFFAGATPAAYNDIKICTAINTTTNTVSFKFAGSGTSPATGTITIAPTYVTQSVGFMTPFNSYYTAGIASPRGQINAWIRSGVFDGYIDWADAVEPTRDSGRWKVSGEDALLPATQTVTVSAVVSTTVFTSDYNRGVGTMASGLVQPITGANAGQVAGATGNTSTNITLLAAFSAAQAIGDTYYCVPKPFYMSADGAHPAASVGGKGGQIHIDNATLSWINAALA